MLPTARLVPGRGHQRSRPLPSLPAPHRALATLRCGSPFAKVFVLFLLSLYFDAVNLETSWLSMLFLKLLFPRSLTHSLFQLFPAFLIILATEINFITLSFGASFQICKYKVRLANACSKYRTLIIENSFLD